MSKLLDIGQNLHKGKYRSDIDGIRAIAVLLVLFCHAFPHYLPSGFIGVDIFFVISGYLITSILIKDFEKDSFSIVTFYKRRILRIFPALILVLAFIIGIGWIFLFKSEFHSLGRHIFASTLFFENLNLWNESSYFDTSSDLKPTLHLWSLAIEEQFYIFWPLIIYLSFKLRFKLLFIIVGLFLISFSINLYDISNDLTAAYYSPLGRSWELLVGAMLAYFQKYNVFTSAKFENLKSLLGLTLIVIGLVFTKPEQNFPGFMALLPTTGTALLISAGNDAWINRRILSLQPMVFLGLISYPLYLWHWPFISFAYIIFGGLSFKLAMFCILASFIAAYLTFIWIEKPLRTRGTEKSKVKILTLSMILIFIFGAFISTDYLKPRLVNTNTPTKNEWDFIRTTVKDFDEKNGNGVYPLRVNQGQSTILIGDSHLVHYAERMNKILNGGATLYAGGGCIPIVNVRTDDPRRAGCEEQLNKALIAANNPDVEKVVIGGAWSVYFINKDDYFFVKENGEKVSIKSKEGQSFALNSLADTIKKYVSNGKKVYLILGNPTDGKLSPFSSHVRVSGLSNNQYIKISKSQIELNLQIEKITRQAGAEVINPMDYVCKQDKCLFTDKYGTPLYKDEGHFNPDWARDNATFVDQIFIDK